jgi:hypothetical protein
MSRFIEVKNTEGERVLICVDEVSTVHATGMEHLAEITLKSGAVVKTFIDYEEILKRLAGPVDVRSLK